MALSQADRIRLGLDDPPPEYGAPPTNSADTGQPVERAPPNLRLVLKDGEKATAPKIRHMVNELLAGNLQQADRALNDLFRINPKLGLELYIELAKFSLPQLKAVAMQIDDRSENPRTLSFAQLQQVLQAD